MNRDTVTAWVDAYVRAWASNDLAAIGDLFAADAAYSTAPYREPWRGRDAIVAGWLGRKDEPGTWSYRYEPLAVAGDLGVVRGWTRYADPPQEFSNLWLIRLTPDGRCREFIEWWMQHD